MLEGERNAKTSRALRRSERQFEKPVDALATVGIDPTSMEEVTSVYYAKVKYAQPDGIQDSEERRVRDDRTKRLNLAYEAIQNTQQGR